MNGCYHNIVCFGGGGNIEFYEESVTCLLRKREVLEIELAIIRSEWDAFVREIRDCYTSVEAIEKFADLNIRQVRVLDELKKLKWWLEVVTARES